MAKRIGAVGNIGADLGGFSPTPKIIRSFPCGSAGKESTCKAGDLGSIPGLGRSPGEEKGCPLQYSGLENSMDYSPWVAKTQTQLSNFHFTSCSQRLRVSKNKFLRSLLNICTAWGMSGLLDIQEYFYILFHCQIFLLSVLVSLLFAPSIIQ